MYFVVNVHLFSQHVFWARLQLDRTNLKSQLHLMSAVHKSTCPDDQYFTGINWIILPPASGSFQLTKAKLFLQT